MNYKLLPKELKKKGIYYTQVWRDQDFAIFSLGSSKTPFLGFEVFEINRHDGYTIKGNKVEPSEYFASDNDFGETAFYVNTREKAELRLEQLRDLKRLRDLEREKKV